MATTMRLYDAIRGLDDLDESGIICAKLPWDADAECQVVQPNDRLGIPDDTKAAGFLYFLEVHVALEALEVFGDRTPNADEKFRLLVHYAENDAFPSWVYASEPNGPSDPKP